MCAPHLSFPCNRCDSSDMQKLEGTHFMLKNMKLVPDSYVFKNFVFLN